MLPGGTSQACIKCNQQLPYFSSIVRISALFLDERMKTKNATAGHLHVLIRLTVDSQDDICPCWRHSMAC